MTPGPGLLRGVVRVKSVLDILLTSFVSRGIVSVLRVSSATGALHALP